jgi:type I restriction enzyme R subunit
MLLTGFDAKRLKKLLFGPWHSNHNLLQTLTRVNRPYKKNTNTCGRFADISQSF